MKKIHILPTDKPSIIGFDSVKNLHFTNDFIDDYQNIYITSSEEIKEGDWCLDAYSKLFKHENHFPVSIGQRKIILTTDQDLDGVQAIPDEFLEWFVKNPSCENIDIEVFDVDYGSYNKNSYEIIIPKEEKTKCYCGHTTYCDCSPLEEPKQETLEEAYLNKLIDEANKEFTLDRKLAKEVAIKFAKWQQERMYSEEDMKQFALFLEINLSIKPRKTYKQLLEEFKKK
jgi:hypothetical protein